MSASTVPHPGGYRFLPGIDAYSSGVIAEAGFEIVHVTLSDPLSWQQGLKAVAEFVRSLDRPLQSICGIELRCPQPHTMDGFVEFNQQYRSVLEQWDVMVKGVNPVARTNVAPVVNPPDETTVHGFSYTIPSDSLGGTFVVAGAGELPTRRLDATRILNAGRTDAEAMQEKADCVLGILQHRLEKLEADPGRISTIDVYTAHPLHHLLQPQICAKLPRASVRGVQWYFSRPPIVDIEFEMDLRGVRQEFVVEL